SIQNPQPIVPAVSLTGLREGRIALRLLKEPLDASVGCEFLVDGRARFSVALAGECRCMGGGQCIAPECVAGILFNLLAGSVVGHRCLYRRAGLQRGNPAGAGPSAT